jgi:hypothetical protein
MRRVGRFYADRRGRRRQGPQAVTVMQRLVPNVSISSTFYRSRSRPLSLSLSCTLSHFLSPSFLSLFSHSRSLAHSMALVPLSLSRLLCSALFLSLDSLLLSLSLSLSDTFRTD